MNEAVIANILKTISRAPSAHNTQPISWSFSSDKIAMHISHERLLHVSDKEMRDLHLSAGAAFYLLTMALLEEGFEAINVTFYPLKFSGEKTIYLECIISQINKPLLPIRKLQVLKNHACYRGVFEKGTDPLSLTSSKVKLIQDSEAIKGITILYDEASVFFLSQKNYAYELWTWLRLKRKDKRFYQDGLNADMLRIDGVLLFLSRFLMKPGVLFWLGKLGLIKAIVTEAPQNSSAEGFVVLLRDQEKSLFEQGQDLMSLWLEIESQGRHFCPVTSLIDHVDFRKKLEGLCQVNEEIIHVLRVGVKPEKEALKLSPRLPLDNLRL